MSKSRKGLSKPVHPIGLLTCVFLALGTIGNVVPVNASPQVSQFARSKTPHALANQVRLAGLPASEHHEATALFPVSRKLSKAIIQTVARGDTMDSVLADLGVPKDMRTFIATSDEASDLSKIKPGQAVTFKSLPNGDLIVTYARRIAPGSPYQSVIVVTNHNGSYSVDHQKIYFDKHTVTKMATIRNSLFLDGSSAGIADDVLLDLVKIFSGDIDFYKELKPGDTVSVTYDEYSREEKIVNHGNIRSATFDLSGVKHNAYAFIKEGRLAYYNEKGEPLKKSFFRAPLAFSRVTSRFSLHRLHPLFKTWKKHTGVDYAAPIGTPIHVTGDGVISFIGEQTGYGRVVIVDHGSGYKTVYGHMSRFAELKVGQKVKQGRIIGFVGMSGWATGPHLHYEFRINDKPVDPLKVKASTAPSLTGVDLKKLKATYHLK